MQVNAVLQETGESEVVGVALGATAAAIKIAVCDAFHVGIPEIMELRLGADGRVLEDADLCETGITGSSTVLLCMIPHAVMSCDVAHEPVLRFEDFGGMVSCIALSPTGHSCFIGTSDRKLRIWDTESSKVIKVLPMSCSVRSIVPSRCGKILYIGTRNGIARVDLATGSVELVAECNVSMMILSPCARFLYAAVGPTSCRVVKHSIGEGYPCEHTYDHQDMSESGLAVSPCGRWVVTCGEDTVRVWDAETAATVSVFDCPEVSYVAVSPCSEYLLCASFCGLHQLRRDSGKLVRDFDATEAMLPSFSPCGKWVYCDAGYCISKFNLDLGSRDDLFQGPLDTFVLSPCGKYVVYSNGDESLMLHVVATGE